MDSDLDQLADVVVETMAEALADPVARIRELEAQVKTLTVALEQKAMQVGPEGPAGRDGRDAKDVDLEALTSAILDKSAISLLHTIEPCIVAMEQRAVPGRDGRDGKDAPPVDLFTIATQAVALMPLAKDGRDGVDGTSPDADAIAAVVVAQVMSQLVPQIIEEIGAQVAKAFSAIPLPKDGLDGAVGPQGANGKDADTELAVARVIDHVMPKVTALTEEQIAKAAAALPLPKDGRDGVDGIDGKDADQTIVAAAVTERLLPQIQSLADEQITKAVSAWPVPRDGADGKDGASVSVDEVVPFIATEIAKAVALMPAPKDGRDGADGASLTVDDVLPLITVEVAKAAAVIPVPKDGKDGRGIAKTIIDQDGQLVVTFSDGAVDIAGKAQGQPGRDGMPGLPGRPAEDGKDGQDGLGFDDIEEAVEDGGRFLVRRYRRGERVKEFRHQLATTIDRGVWKDGSRYERGDVVTWGGSTFIAQKSTTAKPETNDDFRLAVKRGRDGKDGKPGPQGPQGPKGDGSRGQ